MAAAATEWSHGARLHAFITNSDACPYTFAEAASKESFLRVFSNGKEIIAGGSSPPSGGSRSFYIVNGFHEDGGWYSATSTGLMNAEPLGSGGGCWSMEDDAATVGVAPCNVADSQAFYIEAWDAPSLTGPFNIVNDAVNKLTMPVQPGTALGSDKDVHDKVLVRDNGFCFYDVESGAVVGSSSAYFDREMITSLTGQAVPAADNPTPAVRLPGCGDAAASMTIDCAISRAVNGMPEVCGTDPDNSRCVLHLLPAFCGDTPATRWAGGNASVEIEACMRSISQGPCVANPSGAACLSGQFTGISYEVGSGNGGPSSQKCLICGDKKLLVPAEDQFWIDVMKNFINTGTPLLNWFTDIAAEQLQNACLAISAVEVFSSIGSTQRMARNCKTAFKTHQLSRPLDYDAPTDTAGRLFVDVLTVVDGGIGTVAEAAKAMTAVERTIAKFTATSEKVAQLQAGFYLEAKGDSGTVRLFRDGGDGKPVPLATEADQKALKKSLEKSSFENCRKCVAALVRRHLSVNSMLRRQQAVDLNLCCLIHEEFQERPEKYWSRTNSDISTSSDDWSSDDDDDIIIPVQDVTRTIDKLTEAADLSPDQKALLESMRSKFSSFFLDGIAHVDTDAVTRAFYDAWYAPQPVTDITGKAMELYGMTEDERSAIGRWAGYFIEDALELGLASAMAQIPPTTGLCLRTTELSADTFGMLTTAGPGLRSQKTGGVYQVQDLLKIRYFGGELVIPEEPQILASFLGLQREFTSSAGYRFVINSKTGRYIEPLLLKRSQLPEVDFVQGYSDFKLLGWEELNGGAESKAAGKPGPYGVFYFDEIDLGVAQPRICGGSVTTDCRDAEVKPPVF